MRPPGTSRIRAAQRLSALDIEHRVPDGRGREDIRWVPRRLVSSVALPGNDFYLFDDRLALFLLYAVNGLSAGMLRSTGPADLRLCRSAFEAAWKLSIPHREYAPV